MNSSNPDGRRTSEEESISWLKAEIEGGRRFSSAMPGDGEMNEEQISFIMKHLEQIVVLLEAINKRLDRPLLTASARDYGIGVRPSPHLSQGPLNPYDKEP